MSLIESSCTLSVRKILIYSFTENFTEHTNSFTRLSCRGSHFQASFTHSHTYIILGKNEWTFPDDSVGFFMGVDAWLSLSTNVMVNQMISSHHQTLNEPVEPKRQETLNLLASRPELCNNCSTLMKSNPELLHAMISKQRASLSAI